MICDKCKTEVSSTAKFCPNCGANVEKTPEKSVESQVEGAQPFFEAPRAAEAGPAAGARSAQSPVSSSVGAKSSKGPLFVVIVALLVLAGAGGYFLYNAFTAKSPAKIGEQINNELKGKGLNLYCEIDKNWTATLKGSVKDAAEKEAAMGIVKAHKEVKDVKDELQPLVNPSDLKLAIDNALLGAGFVDVLADVDENLAATLKGTVSNENEKADAVKIARAVDKVKDVKDNIQVQAEPTGETASQPPFQEEKPKQDGKSGVKTVRKQAPEPAKLDPFELEVKINRALQNAGFSRVRARVGKRFNVFLNGRVANESRRAKAMAIAESFSGVNNVYDKMVVD